jgi:hypothetical protein
MLVIALLVLCLTLGGCSEPRPQENPLAQKDSTDATGHSTASIRLTGTYDDSTRDTNGDGAPDWLVISAGVHVSRPAQLGIVAFLTGPDSTVYYGRADPMPRDVGDGAIDLLWELKELGEKSGPGAYTLDSLFLYEQEGEFGRMTVYDNLKQRVHTTRSYSADELVYDPIYFEPIAKSRGIDENHDGKFDVFEVEIPTKLRVAGLYAWHVVLKTEHDGFLSQGSGIWFLPAGRSSMRFPLPGSCMAEAPAGAKVLIDVDMNFVPRPPVPPNAPQSGFQRENIELEGVPEPARFDPTERRERRLPHKSRDEYEAFDCG